MYPSYVYHRAQATTGVKKSKWEREGHEYKRGIVNGIQMGREMGGETTGKEGT
jgi:hypothetical protein